MPCAPELLTVPRPAVLSYLEETFPTLSGIADGAVVLNSAYTARSQPTGGGQGFESPRLHFQNLSFCR